MQINASIITIGDELLIGQTIDTNSAWIGQQLNAIGIWVKRRVAVGDVKQDIVQALQQEEKSSNIIIITGGLGPTADDITKPLLCEYFGGQLVQNDAVKKHVIAFFEKRKRPILDVNVAQAMVPNVCEVLWNEMGSAPGMWFTKNNVVYISLPGVPFEMKKIMTDIALPKILTQFKTPTVIHKTACTAGKGESFIAVYLKQFEQDLPNYIKLAYLPQLGGVKLRLTGINVSEQIMQSYFEQMCASIKHLIFSYKDSTLEKIIAEQLINKNLTISFAESCTGGAICAKMTTIPGASTFCKGSIVSYTDDAKINVLGLSSVAVLQQDVVTETIATQMANSALLKFTSDIAVSITGYLDSATQIEETKKGLIWICITNKKLSKTFSANMPYERLQNTELAIATVLNNIRIFIADNY
jgi:nicotinamide-nucleotide amidase